MEIGLTKLEGRKRAAALAGASRSKNDRPVSGRIVMQLIGFIIVAGLATACFQLSQRYVVQSVQVTGSSMSPTLADSNWYLLNRLVYHFRKPKPRDIVVLRDPEDQCYAIKRIVAKPGDSVYVNEGQIFVNGSLLREPYLEPGTKTFPNPRYSAVFLICGENQYFVLGDNLNSSADSRIYGAVPQQRILGRVSP